MKEKSYDYQMRRQEEERWLECDHHGAGSEHSGRLSARMRCEAAQPAAAFTQSHQQYLAELRDEHG